MVYNVVMERIENKIFDEERALYNIKDTEILNCRFAGPADGESVLKECHNILVHDCSFALRYPMWHVQKFVLSSSSMDEKTRAPLWYSNCGKLENTNVTGVKCLRECSDITIDNCDITSEEFGWKCKNLNIRDSKFYAVYMLFESENVEIDNIEMRGKYSFQYMNNLHINNSKFDTKDAFWHSKNVTVENSVLKGEYLAWFSENLTLINCKIIGTQPLCYCKNLKLINCSMEDTDLSFEYSDVDADVVGNVVSIKNPKSGIIKVDSVGEIIKEDAVIDCNADIIIKSEVKI